MTAQGWLALHGPARPIGGAGLVGLVSWLSSALAGCGTAAAVVDGNAIGSGMHDVVRNGTPPAGALTAEERRRFDNLVSDMAAAVPMALLSKVQIVLSHEASNSQEASPRLSSEGEGADVSISTTLVLWAFRSSSWTHDEADSALAFVLAHEVAHAIADPCAHECAGALDCEKRADERARSILRQTRFGARANPRLLTVIATQEKELLVDGVRACRAATPCATPAAEMLNKNAERCLQAAELVVRTAKILIEEGKRSDRGDSIPERTQKRQDLVDAHRFLNKEAPPLISFCSELIQRATPASICRCYQHKECRACLLTERR